MRKNQAENTSKIAGFLVSALTFMALYYSPYLGQWTSSSAPLTEKITILNDECDIFKGEWVRNPRAPYYTNETCWAIADHLNCMKYGKPGTDYMKWRWRPYDCELSAFNPVQFLEMMRGKSMVFVGDSVGRNQMQSLMCLLSRAASPVDMTPASNYHSNSWHYPSHNFTLANLWSTYLVAASEADEAEGLDPRLGRDSLHLDKPDTNWTSQVTSFDYTILSAGHWFFRPTMYYLNGSLVGCFSCNQPNVTSLPTYYGYSHAFRTAFAVLNEMQGYNGLTILRTFTADHFEGGAWNNGGDCVRKNPFSKGEKRLEGFELETYMTQVEEYRKAKREGERMGKRYALLDTTEVTLMRPDGHPGRFGHPADAKVKTSDCVHWCLPGPVDTWNDLLLHMLKVEGRRGLNGG